MSLTVCMVPRSRATAEAGGALLAVNVVKLDMVSKILAGPFNITLYDYSLLT